MRDRIKNIDYFEKFILEDLQRVDKFSNKLQIGEVKAERILPVKAKVHDLKLGIIIAKYSMGDSLQMLEEEYLQLVKEWEEVLEADFYNKNLKMISLAVLFDIDNSMLNKIRQLLQKSNVNDWLFNFLLNVSGDKIIENTVDLLFPESFSTLKKAVNAENTVELLNKYVTQEWYNQDCGCYEAHKSKQNIYYGYWSFEAGAIAKILQIPDETLKDVQYYPYDLVHYK